MSKPSRAEKESWLAASPPHLRTPWNGEGCQEVLVHDKWEVLKGAQQGLRMDRAKVQVLYGKAKLQNDLDAAHELLSMVWRPPVFDELVRRVVESGRRPIIVHPHPSFDDEDCIDHDAAIRRGPRNAIPFAYSARLKEMLNGFDEAPVIVQGARVGRTKLKRFPRFLFQPNFVGDVLTDRPYIIVDDTVALGGTLAALYSHITHHGGTVIAVSALCHSTGKNVRLALTGDMHAAVHDRYGTAFDALWKEKVGHGSDCLTNEEARFLVEWERTSGTRNQNEELQRLRDRLNRARGTFE